MGAMESKDVDGAITERGWLVATALFCEQVLEEKDDVLSVIRIVDRYTVPRPPDGATLEDIGGILPTLLVTVKSTGFVGPLKITIRLEKPDGGTDDGISVNLPISAAGQGGNLISPVLIRPRIEGVHWMYVYADDILAVKIPLTIQWFEDASVDSADPSDARS